MTDRRLLSPMFLAAAAVLLLAAVALPPAVAALERRYSKQTIALRKPLDDFDAGRLAGFEPAGRAPAMVVKPEDLGTDQWLVTGLTDPAAPRAGGLMLFVTYYSDPRDQVPHTPEVCYRQAGATIAGMEQIELPVPGIGDLPVRQLDIRQGAGESVLLYTFCCNGDYYHDREQVRWRIGTPGDRAIYFSKIEVVSPIEAGDTRAAALERLRRLLAEAIPVLAAEHFPRDEDVR